MLPPPPSQADRPVIPPPAGPARHDPGTAAAEPGPPGTAQPASPPKLAGQIGWWVLVALGLLVPWWFNLRYFADGGSVLPQVFSGTQWPMR